MYKVIEIKFQCNSEIFKIDRYIDLKIYFKYVGN